MKNIHTPHTHSHIDMSFSKQILTNKFSCVDETQASIVSISQWCLFHYRHSEETVQVWSEFINKSKKKLPLFYLCNEIIQNARSTKKNDFLLYFSQALPKLLKEIYPTMSDLEKSKVRRIIDVWKQRSIFSDRIIKNLYESVSETVEPRTVSATITKESASLPPEIAPLSSRMTRLSKQKKTIDTSLTKTSRDYVSLFESETLPAPDVYLSKLKELEDDINKHCETGGETVVIRREVVDILNDLASHQQVLISQEEQSIQSVKEKLGAVKSKQSELESLMNGNEEDEEDEDDVAPVYTKGSDDESDSDNDKEESRTKRQKVEPSIDAIQAENNGTEPSDEEYEPPAADEFQSLAPASQPDEAETSGYNPGESETANPNLASLLSKLT